MSMYYNEYHYPNYSDSVMMRPVESLTGQGPPVPPKEPDEEYSTPPRGRRDSHFSVYDRGSDFNDYRNDYNSYNNHNYDTNIGSSSSSRQRQNWPTAHQPQSRRWFRFGKYDWRTFPHLVYIISVLQVGVFIAELVRMGILTGSPIQTQPSFNPMVGPSAYVMINMGARFTPCMHAVPNITDQTNLLFPCPNSTTDATNTCSLAELCGHGLAPAPLVPNQWWRFIVPIFLHAGFVHIALNMVLQLRRGAQLEREIGAVRFFLVYFASGISGFILGGNFTPDGITSTGASGALFGVIAIELLDLVFNWPLYETPVRELLMLVVEIIISLVLGLLPGLDNFAHIGGFAMGLLVGTALLRSPLMLRNRIDGAGNDISDDMQDLVIRSSKGGSSQRIRMGTFNWRQPHRHFHNRNKWWYLWLVVRGAAVVLAIVYYVMLIRQFENGGGHCSWCKYLSCLPVHGWCDEGQLGA